MAPLDLTLGPLMVGFTISTFLFGITTTQAYFYYANFPMDKPRMKVLVTLIWTLEFGHAICLTATMYRLFVTLFGNPAVLFKTPAALDVSVILGAILALTCQGFFIYRVWKTSNQSFTALFLAFLSIIRAGTSFSVGVEAFLYDLKTLSTKFDWLISLIWVSSAVVDVLITICLCRELYRRRKSALNNTVAVLDKIILWTVETGLVTSTTATVLTVCFLVMKSNLIWLGLYFILPRLFANCVIASINSRRGLAERKGQRAMISLGQSNLPFNGDSIDSPHGLQRKPIAIEMTTIVENIDMGNTVTAGA
ncbi:hypothetical protein GYMLUDRAFT_45097 [Collybiopsis luxurians FD-317 M1]|uniref:Unplaced genomic scaffold GYMLUscaffold_35, whole genome shotgun sequence n=1 Tax=Collybiopsis luxurians FD-317 M1 TaxID=944289 RepID=A0A0D0BTN0_9AGAR|nr:hypothetical protein GYMLUDRAFT_45097 [Collybiopsis luxurians FD-317 M1]